MAGWAGLAGLAGLLWNDGTGSRPLQRQWLNSQRMQMNHRSSSRLALNEDLASESFDSHLGLRVNDSLNDVASLLFSIPTSLRPDLIPATIDAVGLS